MSKTQTQSASRLQRFLTLIERAGNALPHPATLFLILTGVVLLLSAVVSGLGIEAQHPLTKNPVRSVNLLSIQGLHLMITDVVKNFTGFAPLGTVLVAMLGFSIAEKSGLLATLLKIVVLKAPRFLLVPAVLLAGVMSHTAGDVGYLLLIPLAALTFHSAGLNPLAGLAISFAGVSGGFAANFLLSTADTLLSGLSQEAARIVDPKYVVSPVSNWYFMATSSLMIIGIGTWVANRITIPFLGEYRGDEQRASLEKLSSENRRGLKAAGLVVLALILFLVAGMAPEAGFLRDPKDPSLLKSPALTGVVSVIFLFGALPGLAFGFVSRNFKSPNDAIQAMQDGMSTLAPYLVLVFFASQFIALFNHSHLGLITAVHGSEMLKASGLGAIPLMIGFIFLTVFLDLIIGSASAKWALMAPVFVPMFMLVGVAPELTQASYRIGDSVVNIISPLMSYFPLILTFANKYEPKARVGTVIALMLPYTIAFLIAWSILLFAWMSLDLPLGPGASLWFRPSS